MYCFFSNVLFLLTINLNVWLKMNVFVFQILPDFLACIHACFIARISVFLLCQSADNSQQEINDVPLKSPVFTAKVQSKAHAFFERGKPGDVAPVCIVGQVMREIINVFRFFRCTAFVAVIFDIE